MLNPIPTCPAVNGCLSDDICNLGERCCLQSNCTKKCVKVVVSPPPRPHPKPKPGEYKLWHAFCFSPLFRLGVGRDLKTRQTYAQIVNFSTEVHTETPREETCLIFVYSGLSARDIIHNVPPANSMVLIPSRSVQRSSVEVASKSPPPALLHWWRLTSNFHNN